jgi:hypothetical protein
MQVLSEFIKSDLTEDQILPVLRELLPVLLTILGSTEVSRFPENRGLSVFGSLYALAIANDASSGSFRFPTMRLHIVYGKGAASSSSKGGN